MNITYRKSMTEITVAIMNTVIEIKNNVIIIIIDKISC